jgi:uncharacterized protein (DUF169 family)
MLEYATIEGIVSQALRLRRHPVAVAFMDSPPAGLSAFAGTEPSGCSFWRLAADGQTFYTVPQDHLNCPIGSYTHNIPIPAERAPELEQTLALMTGIGYLKMEEVPGIPRLPRTPGVIVYAPLGETPVEPDVVLIAGRPGNLMLLYEAGLRAGVEVQPALMGRPTCMALPAALAHGLTMSLGCIGNRVYTDLPEDELYVAIRGTDVVRIADQVGTITKANTTLSEYHRDRRNDLATQ